MYINISKKARYKNSHNAKPVKNLKFKFFRKNGKTVIYRNNLGGKVEIVLDLG